MAEVVPATALSPAHIATASAVHSFGEGLKGLLTTLGDDLGSVLTNHAVGVVNDVGDLVGTAAKDVLDDTAQALKAQGDPHAIIDAAVAKGVEAALAAIGL